MGRSLVCTLSTVYARVHVWLQQVVVVNSGGGGVCHIVIVINGSGKHMVWWWVEDDEKWDWEKVNVYKKSIVNAYQQA